MEYREFGSTGMRVSEVGFGAWAIGGGAMVGTTSIGWGDTDDAESIRAIHTALDRGITFFDTADIYGLGHSEALLGKTIGGKEDVIIATKVGNVARNGQFTTDYSSKHIVQACEASLRRLNRDVIDYYQLHSARLVQLRDGECMTAMEKLRDDGKIRHWGLSLNTFDPMPEAEYLLQAGRGMGFQLVLNILNQRALGVIHKASTAGYGIIARMPLQFGLLTGKFDSRANFAENDHRKNRLTPEVIRRTSEALVPVWKLCEKYDCSRLQLALSYVLGYPAVSTVIPGIRTVEQAKENSTGLIRLDEKDRLLIESMHEQKFAPVMELIQQQG